MDKQTNGTVVSVSKQWWLKINSRSVRVLGTDGAIYPYIIKVTYSVDGKDYVKRKWINAGQPIPKEGSSVQVMYCADNPAKANVL